MRRIPIRAQVSNRADKVAWRIPIRLLHQGVVATITPSPRRHSGQTSESECDPESVRVTSFVLRSAGSCALCVCDPVRRILIRAQVSNGAVKMAWRIPIRLLHGVVAIAWCHNTQSLPSSGQVSKNECDPESRYERSVVYPPRKDAEGFIPTTSHQ